MIPQKKALHIVIVHGYNLSHSGSCTYSRNLAFGFALSGFKVTLVCQDPNSSKINGIDSMHYDAKDCIPEVGKVKTFVPMRPDQGFLLPVYTYNFYEGYEAKAIHTMEIQEGLSHIEYVSDRLSELFSFHKPDFILANHAIFSPINVKRALQKSGLFQKIPYVVKLHGSALNITIRRDNRWIPLCLEGLNNSVKILCGTDYVEKRFRGLLSDFCDGFPIVEVIPEGVNTKLFSKKPHVSYEKGQKPFRVVFIGHIVRNKGIGELVLAMPHLKKYQSDLELYVIGKGAGEKSMATMIKGIRKNIFQMFTTAANSIENEDTFVSKHIDLRKFFIPCESDFIHYKGYMEHDKLSEILSTCDLMVVPSKIDEAFGMVVIQGMAAGVFPLCADHSGLADVISLVGKYDKEIGENMKIPQGDNCVDMDMMISSLKKGIDFVKANKDIPQRVSAIAKNFDWKVITEKIIEIDGRE